MARFLLSNAQDQNEGSLMDGKLALLYFAVLTVITFSCVENGSLERILQLVAW